jgi:hypothetical protein
MPARPSWSRHLLPSLPGLSLDIQHRGELAAMLNVEKEMHDLAPEAPKNVHAQTAVPAGHARTGDSDEARAVTAWYAATPSPMSRRARPVQQIATPCALTCFLLHPPLRDLMGLSLRPAAAVPLAQAFTDRWATMSPMQHAMSHDRTCSIHSPGADQGGT